MAERKEYGFNIRPPSNNMEYFLATIQVEKGFYSKLILATDKESARKLATEFGSEKHGKQFKGVYISETLKEPTAQ